MAASGKFRNSLTILAAAAVCLVGNQAKAQFGQSIIDGGSAADNVASIGGRTPGQLVSSGVARAQTAIQRGRAPVQITEPQQPDTIRANAISQSLDGFLTQFNRILSELLDLLIVRAGGTPQMPSTQSSGL